MYYVAAGTIPRQRHTQHRAPDGSLYAEELFGVEGFSGRSSLLYHVTPPTRTHKLEPGPRIRLEAADDGLHRHRLTKTGDVAPRGDAITGRVPGETFGFDTTNLGDVDGDGATDFLLTSAWSGINGYQSGRTYIISGTPSSKRPTASKE